MKPTAIDLLHAKAAITALVAQFDDAVNRRDVAEFEALWASDAVWEIGNPMPLHVEGARHIVETWTAMLNSTTWLFRGSFVGVVDLTGIEAKGGAYATGRWPCVETGTFTDGKGYDNRAIYEDRYVREEGRWLFQRRHYRYLWLSTDKLPGGAVNGNEQSR
jgi:ketosteroid isomerase-like protein